MDIPESLRDISLDIPRNIPENILPLARTLSGFTFLPKHNFFALARIFCKIKNIVHYYIIVLLPDVRQNYCAFAKDLVKSQFSCLCKKISLKQKMCFGKKILPSKAKNIVCQKEYPVTKCKALFRHWNQFCIPVGQQRKNEKNCLAIFHLTNGTGSLTVQSNKLYGKETWHSLRALVVHVDKCFNTLLLIFQKLAAINNWIFKNDSYVCNKIFNSEFRKLWRIFFINRKNNICVIKCKLIYLVYHRANRLPCRSTLYQLYNLLVQSNQK